MELPEPGLGELRSARAHQPALLLLAPVEEDPGAGAGHAEELLELGDAKIALVGGAADLVERELPRVVERAPVALGPSAQGRRHARGVLLVAQLEPGGMAERHAAGAEREEQPRGGAEAGPAEAAIPPEDRQKPQARRRPGERHQAEVEEGRADRDRLVVERARQVAEQVVVDEDLWAAEDRQARRDGEAEHDRPVERRGGETPLERRPGEETGGGSEGRGGHR